MNTNYLKPKNIYNIKTLAIVGSPRKDGNYDSLVNKILEKLDGNKKVYYLNDTTFLSSFSKNYKKETVFKMINVNKIIDKIQKVEKFIFSFPIYLVI